MHSEVRGGGLGLLQLMNFAGDTVQLATGTDICSVFRFFFFLNLIGSCNLWDLSSLSRDRTCDPSSGSVESSRLDCQGNHLEQMLIIKEITFK